MFSARSLSTCFLCLSVLVTTGCLQQNYPAPEETVQAPLEDPNARAIIETSRYVDSINDQLSDALRAEIFDSKVEMRKTQSDTLQLTISGDDAFKSGHTRLNKNILSVLDRMADVLADQSNTVVHIISHTDSTGSDQTNLTISEKRATVVANHLQRKGVDAERMISAGKGEFEPIMPNDNAEQQALNRRIEIYVRGIMTGNERRAYQTPSL